MITDKASFGLVRTNPKISGNVKITVDASGEVWLNTINATRELSSDNFKRYRTTTTSSYAADLKRFVGRVKPESLFLVRENSSGETTSRSLSEQYDLFYAMGARPLISDAYSEEYAYLAPMWLGDQLPEHFIIFRIDEPMDFPYNTPVPSGSIEPGVPYKLVGESDFTVNYGPNQYTVGQQFVGGSDATYVQTGTGSVVDLREDKGPIDYVGLFERVVRNGHIIKTFDLSEDSRIGSYIRRIKSDARFPSSPITVRFEQDLETTWNGVAYQAGVMTSKGERLDRFWSEARTQIEFEEYITGGFQRQGIISPYLLNLEFLFDDEDAATYSIPRYFGFYVDKNETGRFRLSGQLLFDNRLTSGNIPVPKRPNRGLKNGIEDFFQSNPDGVRLFMTDQSGQIPDGETFSSLQFQHRFYAVQDRDGRLYSIDQRGTQQFGPNDLVLRNRSVNLGRFTGASDLISSGPGMRLRENGRAYMAIRVLSPMQPNDKIRIYWNVGTQSDTMGFFDEITANDLRRPFTVQPGGVTVSLAGDLTGVYSLGDQISVWYDPSNRVARTVSSAPAYDVLSDVTTFDLDAPIGSSTTSGLIEIVPGWGPGSWLASQSLDPIYFHPYGTGAQVATALAGAFNSLPQRDFDAIVDGDYCVLRSRAGNSAANGIYCRFDLSQSGSLEAQGVPAAPGTLLNFRGGTDTPKSRLRVPLDQAEKLSAPGVHIRTRLGLSAVQSVERYVDQAFRSPGSGQLDTLSGFGDFAVVTIQDPGDDPLVGTNGEYQSYTLYSVPVCVLSVYPLRDMDGDFWSSEYSRTPEHEYKRYFDLPAGEPVLVPGRTYYVIGDPALDLVSHDGQQYAAGQQFYATLQQYEHVSGDPLVVPKVFFTRTMSEDNTLGPGVYEVLGDPALDQVVVSYELTGQQTYQAGMSFLVDNTTGTATFSRMGTGAQVSRVIPPSEWASAADPDVLSFPGFAKFKDFLSVQDGSEDQTSSKFRLRDKYSFNDLESEYDYLKENFNKRLSNKSRLVQWISKWVYNGGTDIRDNPYRLNVHPVFGQYNFSPSFDIRQQDPEAFTHEWCYLEGRPNQYVQSWDRDNYYFFDQPLDIQRLTDTSPQAPDYFRQYFNFQPTPDSPLQRRYSRFVYNRETGVCETMFRGIKLNVREIIRDTRVAQQGQLPSAKQNSTRYDGYRFSSVLRVRLERQGEVEAPVLIDVLDNQTARTLTMVVTVVVEDYRTIQLTDPRQLGSQASPQLSYPGSLDNRIDYTLLYSMKDKRSETTYMESSDLSIRGLDASRIADIKLSVSINLASPSIVLGGGTAVSVLDNQLYDWDLRDEIRAFGPANSFFGEYQFGQTFFMPATGVTQRQIQFPLPFPSAAPPTFQTPVGTGITVPTGSQFEWSGFATYQREGGAVYLASIMQRVSFAAISEKVNQYSRFVRYRSFRQTVLGPTEVPNDFFLEMVRPSEILLKSALVPVPDEDRPEELAGVPVIGTDLLLVNSAFTVRRYSGGYSPKFRDVLYFGDQTGDQVMGTDLSFSQALFNPNVPGFGLLKNFGYLKVSDGDVLALSQNDAYPSLYPLINEYAIDRIDFPVYLSGWDPGFYRTFITATSYRRVAGTRQLLEQPNFLASKIMKTRNNLNLQTFRTTQVSRLEDVSISDLPDELVFEVTVPAGSSVASGVRGYVDVRSRLLRFMIEDGAAGEFEKYLLPEFGVGDPDDLTDDVRRYLELNVLPTYEIKSVTAYQKRFNDGSLAFVEGGLTDQQKIQMGYLPGAGTDLEPVAPFVYRFSLSTDGISDTSLSISILVGKI